MDKNLITFNFIQDFIPAGTGIRKPKQYSKLTPEGLVWHLTENTSKGAGAKTHRRYFAQPNVENGTHYVIDDTYVIQMVPDTELVWHSGPSRLYTDWLKRNFPKGANASCMVFTFGGKPISMSVAPTNNGMFIPAPAR